MRGAPAGSAGDKRSTLLVLVGMGLIFLVALGVILYFALGAGAGTGTEGPADTEETGEVAGTILRIAGPGVDLHMIPEGAPDPLQLTRSEPAPAG